MKKYIIPLITLILMCGCQTYNPQQVALENVDVSTSNDELNRLKKENKIAAKKKQEESVNKQIDILKKVEKKHGHHFCEDTEKHPFHTDNKCLIGLNGIYMRIVEQTPKGTLISYDNQLLLIEYNSMDANIPEGYPTHDGLFLVDGSVSYPSLFGTTFKRLRRIDSVIFMRIENGWGVLFPNIK